MPIVRPYREASDAQATGRLIADTYSRFNLDHLSPEELPRYLGPFQNAHSADATHQAGIAAVIDAPLVLVAEVNGQIAGVLRGRPGRLHSLFVGEAYHRQGIGRLLMNAFEAYCRQHGSRQVTLASTLYAVPFYASLGYKRSTGVRRMRSFDGNGLPYQPMKKTM